MEVKIFCPCGAKYKFDVEPLNGRLPGPVACPVCGADGTALGNEVLARMASPAAHAVPPVSSISAPQASSVTISAPPVPQSSQPSQPVRAGFVTPTVPKSSKDIPPGGSPSAARVIQAAPTPTAGTIKVVPTPTLAPAAGAPKLLVQAAHAAPTDGPTAAQDPAPPTTVSRPQSSPVTEPSFTRGVIGIAAASFVGLLLWFAITLFLGTGFKWFAIGIGALIGWTGIWLAKQKSQNLGLAAASATALVMIIGVLWSARHEAYQAVNETLEEMWQEQLSYAKEAVTASRSDDQLRAFLSKSGLGPSEERADDEGLPILRVNAMGSDSIDTKTLSDFKRNELPNLRKLAEGKVSKNQFEREHRPGLEAAFTLGFIFVSAFKIRMLILIGLAIGAAWKFTAP